MKHGFKILSILALLTSAISCNAEEPRKPNVIVFLIDDLGWADLGITGSTFYETPHVDQLAKDGAFFDNAYAANPVCSPTRASILTGKYPSRIGLSNHSGAKGSYGPKYKLNPPEVKGNMPLEDITLAEALKEAGYTTAHIGKWHLQAHYNKSKDHYPKANGFDVNIAGHKMGQPGDYYFPYTSKKHPTTNVPNMEDGKKGDYLTDALTDKAIQFIKEQGDEPFLLNCWYYTVHTPIIADKSRLKKYEQKAKAMGVAGIKESVPVMQSFSRKIQNNPQYATMVESMDQNIGRILNTLKEQGLEENTLVVFMSDNGGLSTGPGNGFPTSNLPLKAGKAWVYEGGIRSPLIIKYPAKIKAGQTISQPAVSTDVYPTILDLAGLELKPEQHVDGVSLKPLTDGVAEKLDRKSIFFHYPHYHHICSMGPAGAVREGHWKLVIPYETGELELYNVVNDIGETKNLVEKKPEMAQAMHQRFKQWIKESGSLMPTLNANYDESIDYRIKH